MSALLHLEALYQDVQPELDSVRVAVERQWTDAFQLVYGPKSTPPALGGKMLRPALTLLSAGAIGAKNIAHFVDMAAAMELLHLAALAHDDVVDRADLRRGETSLNARWNNHMAVLGGDYLVARALTVLTDYDDCKVIASALQSIQQMAEGELMNFGKGAENLGENDSIRLAQKKTASLFAVSCCTPSLLLGNAFHDELHRFGMGLGTAFQLIDDLLDLEQNSGMLGKPSCGDLIEGKSTLPILYLREGLSDKDRTRLDGFCEGTMTDEDREWVAAAFQETDARDRTLNVARAYIDQASNALSTLPDNSHKSAMQDLAGFVLVRQS